MYEHFFYRIKLNDKYSRTFSTEMGVIQGGVLSPILFSIFINDMIEELTIAGHGIQMNGLKIPALLFADDVTLIPSSVTETRKMLQIVEKFATKWKCSFGLLKCGVMPIVNRGTVIPMEWKFAGGTIATVTGFQFLGLLSTK
jgi:hypothetical protein